MIVFDWGGIDSSEGKDMMRQWKQKVRRVLFSLELRVGMWDCVGAWEANAEKGSEWAM